MYSGMGANAMTEIVTDVETKPENISLGKCPRLFKARGQL